MSRLIASHIRCVHFLSSPAAPCCREPSLRFAPIVALQRVSVLVRVTATRRSSIIHLLHGSASRGADETEERKKKGASVSLLAATCTSLPALVLPRDLGFFRPFAAARSSRASTCRGRYLLGCSLRSSRLLCSASCTVADATGAGVGPASDKLRWAPRKGSAT